MSFWEFYHIVYTDSIEKKWPMGQSLWNNLCKHKFDLFEKMKSSCPDPFYEKYTDSETFVECAEFIKTHWDD